MKNPKRIVGGFSPCIAFRNDLVAHIIPQVVKEKMEINFHITKENFATLTWDDWEALENAGEGKFSARALKKIAARFVCDAEKKPCNEKDALAALGQLNVQQMLVALTQLGQAINEYAAPK